MSTMKMRKHLTRAPRVIAVVSMQSSFGPSVLRGVFSHIAASGEWGLEIIRTAKDFTRATIQNAIKHRVEGVIVALNDEAPEAFRALADSAIPFTTIETYSSILDSRKFNAFHVKVDNSLIGRDAARLFITQGRYDSFGYISPVCKRPWSTLREEGFSREIRRRGRTFSSFSTDEADDPVTRRGELAKWLRKLTKPAAVLAADDSTALDVLQACASAHLSVPRDVSVMGVDNEELICENATVSLSSLRPDFTLAGRKAAEELDRMMRRPVPPRKTGTVTVLGNNEFIQRASTSAASSAGPLVQKALSFIENNSRRGIGVKDVQDHLKVSRSLMDLRFREIRGESVLTVILNTRLRELKRMLHESDDPIESITRQLGWSSANYPKNLFRKHFGISMSQWRQQHKFTATPPQYLSGSGVCKMEIKGV